MSLRESLLDFGSGYVGAQADSAAVSLGFYDDPGAGGPPGMMSDLTSKLAAALFSTPESAGSGAKLPAPQTARGGVLPVPKSVPWGILAAAGAGLLVLIAVMKG